MTMDVHSLDHHTSSALHRLGPISLLLASAALVAASIPYLRVLALPLSLLGIILGAIALMSPDKRKSGIGLPLAGGAASLAVFFLAGLWLDQFQIILGGWRKSPAGEQKTVPLRNQANRSGTDHAPTDWVDASQEAVQLGDVRVRLVSAAIGTVELKDAKGKKRPSEKCLILKVRVSNAGAARVVQFSSWYKLGSLSEKGVPLLHDNQGRLYSLKSFPADVEVVGRITQASLPPGKKVEEVLIFEGRPTQVEFLRLELPASAFGSQGSVRMQIPSRMIQGR